MLETRRLELRKVDLSGFILLMRLLANRVDVDGLALLSSLVPIASFAGLATTDQRMISALATYHAANPNDDGSMIAFVGNHIQFRDWTSDLAALGAGYLGGDAESNTVAAMIGPGRNSNSWVFWL